MNRLAAKAAHLAAQGRRALVPYVVAGYPYADITPALMHVLVEGGADALALGVPFSGPSGDDPVIQVAHQHALRLGTGLPQVLDHVRQFRQSDSDTPVVLLGHAHLIECHDPLRQPGALAEDAARAGVDGLLAADGPQELSGALAGLGGASLGDAQAIGARLIDSLAGKPAAEALAAASDLIRATRRQLDLNAAESPRISKPQRTRR